MPYPGGGRLFPRHVPLLLQGRAKKNRSLETKESKNLAGEKEEPFFFPAKFLNIKIKKYNIFHFGLY